MRLPLADLEEQIVATAKNLEGSDASPLQAASERYGADALLAVHARQNGTQWEAKWRLWLGDQKEQGTVQGADTAWRRVSPSSPASPRSSCWKCRA